MKKVFIILEKFIIVVNLFAAVALAFGFYHLYQKDQTGNINIASSNKKADKADLSDAVIDKSFDECPKSCSEIIDAAYQKALGQITPLEKETIVEKQTVVTSEVSGTNYISMGTTFSTNQTDWTDVDDSYVYIDLANDYDADATVSWEASLKVAHGNGKAFVRLYDDTNKIAVDGSELTSENNVSFLQVSTGDLPFWRGRNLYKVQIKSLNSFEVTISGAKIKVRY